MKRLGLFFLLLILSASTILAAPIDTNKSKLIATNFYSSREPGCRGAEAKLAYVKKSYHHSRRDSITCFRIYNVGNGYVIVSADDCLQPILGYSTESTFNANEIPIQLQDWFEDQSYPSFLILYSVFQNKNHNTHS